MWRHAKMVRCVCFAAIPRPRNGSAPCLLSPNDLQGALHRGVCVELVSAFAAIRNRAQCFHKKIAQAPQKHRRRDGLWSEDCLMKKTGANIQSAAQPTNASNNCSQQTKPTNAANKQRRVREPG